MALILSFREWTVSLNKSAEPKALKSHSRPAQNASETSVGKVSKELQDLGAAADVKGLEPMSWTSFEAVTQVTFWKWNFYQDIVLLVDGGWG